MDIKEMENDARRLHRPTIDTDVCMGCMRCVKTCCYDVWKWNATDHLPEPAYPEECVACLQCMYYCPSGAIFIEQASVSFYDPLFDPCNLND